MVFILSLLLNFDAFYVVFPYFFSSSYLNVSLLAVFDLEIFSDEKDMADNTSSFGSSFIYPKVNFKCCFARNPLFLEF